MAAFPDRAKNAIVLTAAHAAAYAHTAADPAPGSATESAAPGRPASRRSGPEPFWTDMISPGLGSPAPRTLSGIASGGAMHAEGDAPVDRAAGSPRPQPQPMLAPSHSGSSRAWRWDLVVIEQGCQAAGDGLGLLGADRLSPGGILAVLTHSEQRGGRLLDPTGSIVASAQAADLLYLQHIVLLTEHLHVPQPTGGTGTRLDDVADSGDGPDGAGRGACDVVAIEEDGPGGGVMDLLLFLQPSAPSQTSAAADPYPDRPAEPVAGATSGPVPESGSAGTANGDRA